MKAYVGSSPRVWGILSNRFFASIFARFIPTGVGNTWKTKESIVVRQVHPHGCGEYVLGVRLRRHAPGSSPRAWGTQRYDRRLGVCHRFIPTSVGNTRCRGEKTPAQTVHPHERGEHLSSSAFSCLPGGSSPRAWGTRCSVKAGVRHGRFIPTSVGNTTSIKVYVGGVAVHPHERGEHA